MGTYYNMVKSAPHKAEAKMWESVVVVDELLESIKEVHPDEYRAFMRKQRVIIHGPHYDEECAKEDVEKMHHSNKQTGLSHTGEHYTMGKAKEVLEQYRSELKHNENVADVYVAINTNWHDKECLFSGWFGESADDNIIEDAVRFFFADEDAPEGKVYLYMSAMND